MRDVVDAIWGREFVVGLVFGVGALTLAVAGGFLLRRRSVQPLPVGGALLALAAMLALPVATPVPTWLWWGVALLLIGGLAVEMWPLLARFGPALAAPGAWVISTGSLAPGTEWVRWFVLVAILTAAPFASRFAGHSHTSTWTPVMFALFSVGIFLSVPDTEESLVLLGVSTPLALLSIPGSRTGFGAGGAFATLGVAMWVIVQGGMGRPAAMVGATACLGLLLADPVARLLPTGHGSLLDRFPAGWGGLVMASLLQLLLVVGVARTAGLAEEVTAAALTGATVLVTAVAVLVLGTPATAGGLRSSGS